MRESVMTLFCLLRGAAMLNIRINFAVDLKKLARVVAAILFTWSQVLTPAVQALPILPKPEKAVTVSLQYLTVTTTRSGAEKALASPYVKYFDPQTIAFLTEYAKGASITEWKCLDNLWSNESHFNPKALNMGSHAFGIAQFLPSTWGNYKVSKTPVASLQIQYGLQYIKARYGSKSDPSGVCNAWSFWDKKGWY